VRLRLCGASCNLHASSLNGMKKHESDSLRAQQGCHLFNVSTHNCWVMANALYWWWCVTTQHAHAHAHAIPHVSPSPHYQSSTLKVSWTLNQATALTRDRWRVWVRCWFIQASPNVGTVHKRYRTITFLFRALADAAAPARGTGWASLLILW